MRRPHLLLPAVAACLALAGCATHVALAPGQRFPIFFTNASVTPDEAGRGVVAHAAEWARRYPGERITVTGFADPRARQTEVQQLATRRADEIAALLEEAGIAPDRISRATGDETLIGYTGQGNRRVDIAVGL